MDKIVLTLEGLDCANCAAKLENKIQKLDFTDNCNIDFISKKLTVVLNKDIDKNNCIKKIENEIHNFSHDIKVINNQIKNENIHTDCCDDCCCHCHDDGERTNPYSNLFQIVLSAVLLIVSIFISHETTKFLILLLSFAIAGYEVILNAVKKLLKGRAFDESLLMTIATIGAFCIGKYREGVTVMLFYQIGEFFQGLAVYRSRKSISELMDIRPDYANLKSDSKIEKVDPCKVKKDDIIIIYPGEKIPLDGIVTRGNSTIDSKALTGESVPLEAETGTKVMSGCVNLSGVIEVSVTNTYETSTATKILELVENSQAKKAVTEKFITRFSKVYTPLVVISAFLLTVIPPIFINGASFSEWLYRALIFLVISCPCALVISIPLSFFGGIGGASRSGILIKGASALEQLSKAEIVAFDKTGTLTEGSFTVTDIISDDKEKLIETASHLECFSSHPVAVSITKLYNNKIDKSRITDLTEISGLGIKAVFDKKECLAGNIRLMDKYHINVKENTGNGTAVYVACDGKCLGTIIVSDSIKKDAKKAIEELHRHGIRKTVLLTGDKDSVGQSTAKALGIDKAYTELLPQDKVTLLEKIMKTKMPKTTLAYVGDGINDAPVLARADVGIAMGGIGSDSAVEAADIVIMNDEPSKIASAIKISKKTMTIAKENIVFALGIKALILILGGFGFATMWMAVFADVGVSLLAILNSLRAMKKA